MRRRVADLRRRLPPHGRAVADNASVRPPPPGTVLDGKYVLEASIGHGRFGTVYRARHVALQRPVALKLLHDAARLAAADFQQFRIEAEALARLDHPNIVTVLDFGIDPADGGLPYLVMELVEGRSLHEVTAGGEPVDLTTAAPWLRQVGDALQHAHAHGVAHGDLTSRNVVVLAGGERVKVVDFGLAQLEAAGGADADPAPDPTRRAVGRWALTPEYGAPERQRGESPTAASDVYAFAVLAYRVLTGTFPFTGSARDIVLGHLTQPPPAPSARVPALPPGVDAALAAGLAKRAADRPTASVLAGQMAVAARSLALGRWRQRERPRRMGLAFAIAVAVSCASIWLPAPGVVARLEGLAEDLRFASAPARTPDTRLLLVAIDDDSLAEDARPLAQSGDEFAAGLAAAFDAGVRAVALDLLLPEAWADSAAFGALLTSHADRLVLGMVSNGDTVIGPEAIGPLATAALGPARASNLFALVSNTPAADGVVRRGRTAVRDVTATPRHTLAGRMAVLAGATPPSPLESAFVVDFTVASERFDRLSWRAFTLALADGARFDRRLVIVGAEFAGSGDRHRVARPGGWPVEVSGLTLQGLLASTLLQGPRLQVTSVAVTWLSCALVAFVVTLSTLWLPRRAVPVAVAIGIAGGVLVAFATLRAGLMMPLALPLLGWLTAAGIAGALRAALPNRPE